jgi:hypothetical protein
MNIAKITNDPDWNDTDLYDNAYTWRDFTKGVEMTDDGRAIVDFYVYNRMDTTWLSGAFTTRKLARSRRAAIEVREEIELEFSPHATCMR